MDFKKKHLLRGSGELLGMALASIVICTIFVFLVAFFQFSGAVNAMTNAAVVASRATAICNDEKTAKVSALNVSKVILSRNKAIKDVSVTIKPVSASHANGKFEPGQLVKVTVNSRIKTIEPYIVSRDKISRSYVVMIEGLGGGTFNGSASAVEKAFFQFASQTMRIDGKPLTKATVLAIMANLQAESGFDVKANSTKSGTDRNGSVGLMQWTGSRKTELISKHPNDWQTPQGQFAYLEYEMNQPPYSETVKRMNALPNTKQGAYDASDMFLNEVERPSLALRSQRKAKHRAYIDKHW